MSMPPWSPRATPSTKSRSSRPQAPFSPSTRASGEESQTFSKQTKGLDRCTRMRSLSRYPREPREFGIARKRSACSPEGPAVTTSPDASSTSASKRPSWKKPWRKEEDSMPMPTIAPPTVMVRSSGVTSGATPRGSVSLTNVSKVAEASMSHQSSSVFTSSTCTKPLRSRRLLDCSRAAICWGRKVFEVVALNIRSGPGCFAAAMAL
mmetsp:Transcript_81848/g.217216  ORF Transcript_81848/g.217216 Transcript_81848/m.217216 type:complete len:207 (+) Transcript_81848:230-850(+)